MTEHSAGSSDPWTLEVYKNAMRGIADEMAITMLRTAHSQIVAESMDFSAALCDQDGRVVAQSNTLPVHLGSVPDAMAAIFDCFASDLHAGDAYILNDPDLGGMHLPDVFVIMPIFVGTELYGFAVSTANHADIGGAFPGSMSVQARSIFAEGIQIPPLKLAADDVVDETLLRLILRNVRDPEGFRGDLHSQMAVCNTGISGIQKLVCRYGGDDFRRLAGELLDHSEALLVDFLAGLQPGVYEFTDYLDDDGINNEPVALCVRVSIGEGRITFDFDGSSRQVPSALNATRSFTKSACYAALQAIVGGNISANAGFYRPVDVLIPPGSILDPRRPAARGARGLTGHRLIEVLLGALGLALPDQAIAAGDGGPNNVVIGLSSVDGSPIVVWDVLCGSWGARSDKDGIDGVSPLGANLANTPIEEMERGGRVRVERYGFVPDSGGPGRWRGGLSVLRDLSILSGEGTLEARSDRRRIRPYGWAGGCSGAPSLNILNPETARETVLPTKPSISVRAGDLHRHITGSGGGYGDPLDRNPQLVLEDVLDGKVTVGGARENYGVSVSDDRVDYEATRRLREAGRQSGRRGTRAVNDLTRTTAKASDNKDKG